MTRGNFNLIPLFYQALHTLAKEQLMPRQSLKLNQMFHFQQSAPSTILIHPPLYPFCIVIILVLFCVTPVCVFVCEGEIYGFKCLSLCLLQYSVLGHIRRNSMGQLTYLVEIVSSTEIILLVLLQHCFLYANTRTQTRVFRYCCLVSYYS